MKIQVRYIYLGLMRYYIHYACLRGVTDRVSEICMRLRGFETSMSHIYKFINFTGGDGVVGD